MQLYAILLADEESELNRVATAHEFEAILWTLRDPDTTLLKLILAGTYFLNYIRPFIHLVLLVSRAKCTRILTTLTNIFSSAFEFSILMIWVPLILILVIDDKANF